MQLDPPAAGRTIAHESPLPERPPRRGRRPRRIGMLLGITALAVAASACTPEEIAFVAAVSAPYEQELSPEQLDTLRQCESGGNYEAVDRTGSFRGAYQFTRGTWDSVASRHFEWLVGIDPAEADPWWQDVMARALYGERGRAPWPVCGRRL
jgi:Transglycosylase-like domain